MILVDGKALQEERLKAMRAFVEARGTTPVLAAIAVDPDAPTRQFLHIKTKVAEAIGIRMETEIMPREASRDEVHAALRAACESAHGVVLQLPFPAHVPMQELFAALPSDLDPDCLGVAAGGLLQSGEHVILPPVVAAIALMCRKYSVTLHGKRAVVVGQGRLVGAPAALWLEQQGASVVRLTKADTLDAVREADILVLGAGAPGIITPSLIKERVAIFDAGTSEEGGKVVGDADPACAEKASLMTPVPGGIGPLAVAFLFENLLTLRFDLR